MSLIESIKSLSKSFPVSPHQKTSRQIRPGQGILVRSFATEKLLVLCGYANSPTRRSLRHVPFAGASRPLDHRKD